MKLILLSAAIISEVMEYDVEYLRITFETTLEEANGKRYGMTKNIPMVDIEEMRKDMSGLNDKAHVWAGSLLLNTERKMRWNLDNYEEVAEEMKQLIIEGVPIFFEKNFLWSKRLRHVTDIKAGQMILDVVESKDYILERDIRVVTKV